MQSPCHILIAFTCFSDLLHELGQYPFVYHFYNRSNMPQHTCLYLQLIPVYGACIGSPLILSLGVDRLIAISFPSRYRFLQTIPYSYVACQLTLPMAYTIYLLTWALVTREDSFKNEDSIQVDFRHCCHRDRRLVCNVSRITVNIGLAANVFVYYAINSEYRAVIKQMFGRRFFISTVKEISAKQSTMHGLDSKSRINGKKSATILFQPR
ncbi:hypothetical protein RB195_026471 [Necator americanus]|uniref:G-protein coupled receptors family 1 profile domain-containing protein n=1 Tax=Necator americanus TaxID=51031 RepID=A0ABR1EX49_NECAM